MRYETSGHTTAPIAVDRDFVKKLRLLGALLTDHALSVIATRHKISLEEVKGLHSGSIKSMTAQTPRFGADAVEFERYLEGERLRFARERILSDIKFDANSIYQVDYVGGDVIKLEDFDEFEKHLFGNDESVKSFSIYARSSSRDSAHIFFSNSWHTCRFYLSGDREFCDRLKTNIERIALNSFPPIRIAHNRLATGAASVIMTMVGLLLLRSKIAEMYGFTIVNGIGYIIFSNVASAVCVWILFGLFEKLFPKLQIEFGRSWNELRAKRKVAGVILTVIFIPALISAAF